MKKIILSVAVLAVFFTGCKKKEDDPAPSQTQSKSKTELLTAHSWKFTGSVSNVAIDTDDDASTPNTKDLYNEWSLDCEKDDIYTFSANNTGTINDAGTVCDPNGSITFTWVLSGNTLVLSTGTGANTYVETMTLVSIDDNTLKVNYAEDEDPNGVKYIQTDTYTK